MTTAQIADQVAAWLKEAIRELPEGFYDSTHYTATGNNLTHPVTMGLLAKYVWGMQGVAHVGIDCRLKATGEGLAKCQPDLVAFNSVPTKGDSSRCFLLIDYESPNSSDTRVVNKDVDPFLNWCKVATVQPHYLVITTLPKKQVKHWICWECPEGKTYQDMKESPYQCWYGYFRTEFEIRKKRMKNVAVININGKDVQREFPN